MTLNEAKTQVDRTLASLFYARMKDVKTQGTGAQESYKQSIEETSKLLLHMRDRLDVLFGQDSEALAQFLYGAGVIPKDDSIS